MSDFKLIEPGKWYVEYDENGQRTAYVYEDSACRLLGFNSREEYISALGSWDAAIHPDDKERVNRLIADVEAKHPEGLDFDAEYRIMTKWGFHRIHDHGHVNRREDGTPFRVDGVTFDIQDILEKEDAAKETEKQKAQLELKQTELSESLAFTNFFLGTYVSAYYVSLADLSCKVYKRTEELDEKYPVFDDYLSSLESYIKAEVHPDDRASLLEAVKPENIRRTLKGTAAFYNIFRDISDETEKYYKLQIIRGADEDHAALGFEDLTREFRDQEKHYLGAIPLSSDILTKANIGLWSFELDEGCAPRMYADEAMLGLIGLDHQIAPEETYHAWYDHIDAGSYELVNDAVAKMISGEHAEVQYPWHHPNGETWIVRCGGVRNPEYTKGIRIEGTHQDVTRVLHLDEEMKRREKESLFNYFIDSYDSAYFVDLANRTFEILHMDSSLASVFGKCGETLQDMLEFIGEHVHPDDREMMLQMIDVDSIRERLRTEKEISFTVREIFGDREKTMRGQIIRGAGEDHVAVGFMDITAQAMEQQKRLLGAIPLSSDVLTKANIGLWSFELDEGSAPRMYADEAMLGLIGLDHQIAPEDTYHAWYDHIDDGSYDLVQDAVNKMISGEHAEVQYPWHHPDGSTWIVRCGGVRNPEYTKGIRIEGTHQNVTELLHYDEEQRKLEEKQRMDELARVQAEASSKAKTDFLFNMSHDIRTPMNAILGYTGIARKKTNEPETAEYLQKIDVAGNQLLSLVNQVLEMSRIESGKIILQEQKTDVDDFVSVINTVYGDQAKARGLHFKTEILNVKHRHVLGDNDRLSQISNNLIGNALKYTLEGGSVLVNVEEEPYDRPGYAIYKLVVEDTGIGMSEEFLPHIFEEFSREATSTVSQIQGTGLGMPIVKKLVDLMGGTIEVSSKLGAGSRFIVRTPLKIDQEFTEEEQTAQSEEEISLHGMKILLVEDNEMNREIAEDILCDVGASVDTAEDGVIAVEKVKNSVPGQYDVILMDIQMPRMNGYEATKKIRALENKKLAGIKIFAMTANAFEEDRENAIKAGMNGHIAKPIDIPKLLGMLSHVR